MHLHLCLYSKHLFSKTLTCIAMNSPPTCFSVTYSNWQKSIFNVTSWFRTRLSLRHISCHTSMCTICIFQWMLLMWQKWLSGKLSFAWLLCRKTWQTCCILFSSGNGVCLEGLSNCVFLPRDSAARKKNKMCSIQTSHKQSYILGLT